MNIHIKLTIIWLSHAEHVTPLTTHYDLGVSMYQLVYISPE